MQTNHNSKANNKIKTMQSNTKQVKSTKTIKEPNNTINNTTSNVKHQIKKSATTVQTTIQTTKQKQPTHYHKLTKQ